ncbi:hypothetical protein YC2023_112150 [Brassica napus]
MANARVFLSDLKSGRCSEVRLLRFWEARNIKRGDELMSVDMLLLDSNVTSRPYITGELTAVKSHVSDRPKDKDRVMTTIKIERKIFLNATSGTRYDKETDAGESYFYNFFVEGFAKVEPMKIAELNQFIITPQPQDGATSWTLEITCLGSVSLSAKMFGGGNEKENNSGSRTSTGLILKKAQTTTSAKVNIITELAKFSRADVRNLMASSPILDEAAQNPQPTGIQAS